MKASMRKVFRLAVLAAGLGTILVAPAAASANQVTTAAPKPLAVQFDTIVSYHSGTCIDVDGASQSPGARVQIYTCNGTVA